MSKTLSDLILQFYPIREVYSFDALDLADGRLVYKVDTNKGKYVLKVMHPERGDEDISRTIDNLQLLRKHKIPAPKLLKTKKSTYFLPFEDTHIYMYQYIEATQPQGSGQFFRKLGKLLGQMHSITLSEYQHDASFTPQNLLPKLRQALENNMSQEARLFKDEIDSFPTFDHLPRSFIHSDIWHKNILSNKKKLYLIDLDKAGQGTAMLDIAITICKLCILDLMEYKYATKNQKSIIRIKQKYIQSFLKSYLKHRYLTDEERNMLMHGIKYGFLMNAIDLDSQTLKITWNDYQMLCQMATIV